MDKILYYKTETGRYVNTHDVEKAFEIVKGRKKVADYSGYLNFLWELLNSTLAFKPDITVEELINAGCIAYAVQLYRDTHDGCTLVDAKKAVDALRNS